MASATVLASSSTYHRHTVETKYYDIIKHAFEKVSGKKCDVALVVVENKEAIKPPKKQSNVSEEVDKSKIGLFIPRINQVLDLPAFF